MVTFDHCGQLRRQFSQALVSATLTNSEFLVDVFGNNLQRCKYQWIWVLHFPRGTWQIVGECWWQFHYDACNSDQILRQVHSGSLEILNMKDYLPIKNYSEEFHRRPQRRDECWCLFSWKLGCRSVPCHRFRYFSVIAIHAPSSGFQKLGDWSKNAIFEIQLCRRNKPWAPFRPECSEGHDRWAFHSAIPWHQQPGWKYIKLEGKPRYEYWIGLVNYSKIG